MGPLTLSWTGAMVNEVIGEILPFAVGVAIAPIPIIAAVLMLLSAQSKSNGPAYLLGWVIGLVVLTVLFIFAGSLLASSNREEPGVVASWIRLALGVALGFFAIQQFRSLGKDVAPPAWMASLDSFSTSKALGLGLALGALNPKSVVLTASAGLALSGLSGSDLVIATSIYVACASLTVVVPVVMRLVRGEQMNQALATLQEWLGHNTAAIMGTLFSVFAVLLIGKGIGGL